MNHNERKIFYIYKTFNGKPQYALDVYNTKTGKTLRNQFSGSNNPEILGKRWAREGVKAHILRVGDTIDTLVQKRITLINDDFPLFKKETPVRDEEIERTLVAYRSNR